MCRSGEGLLWSCLLVVVVSVSASTLADTEALHEWLVSNGVNFVRPMSLQYNQDQGIHVIADEDIISMPPYGIGILEIPLRLAMNVRTAFQSDFLGPVLRYGEEHRGIDFRSGRLALSIHLLVEKNNPSSFWRVYIHSLPKSLETPMFWSKEDQELLHGTWMMGMTLPW